MKYSDKIVFFNWPKMLKVCNKDLEKALKLFYYYSHRGKHINKWDPINVLLKKDYSGLSYMLNPYDLFSEPCNASDKLLYVHLASLRNWNNYDLYGDSGLYTIFSPVSEEKLLANPLIQIEDNRIVFKHEKGN